MGIKVIVELRAQPGRRAELLGVLGEIVEREGAATPGFTGSTRYEVVGDPDVLVEIAEWESAEARMAHMEESASSGAYAPLAEVLAEPPRAIVIRRLD